MNMSERVCLISGMMKHVGAMAMAAMMFVVVSFVTSCSREDIRLYTINATEIPARVATYCIGISNLSVVRNNASGAESHSFFSHRES